MLARHDVVPSIVTALGFSDGSRIVDRRYDSAGFAPTDQFKRPLGDFPRLDFLRLSGILHRVTPCNRGLDLAEMLQASAV
jgi:hypothetical protein